MAPILAIDQGTSATKALVVSPEGETLAEATVPVHPITVGLGGVEQDPEELWASVLEAGRQALADARVRVAAIGLANQGETVLAWDRSNGQPLSTAVSWQDRRAADVCERMSSRADELQQITGLPLDPYFAAPKMRWLREHATTDGVVTTTDAWLLDRLAGAFVTDYATASRTMLLDLATGGWSETACEAFGIELPSLPELRSSAGPIGETTAFQYPVPISGLAVDQQAALFAEGCLEAGQAKCTYGTGAFLLVTVGSVPPRSRSRLAACVAWKIGDELTYCLDGQVYSAGSALTWLTELGLLAGAADLDREAGRTASEGVLFIPGLAGLGAPFWRPAARGAFSGLSLSTGRSHLVRAVLEGVATAVAWVARTAAVELGCPLKWLRADGGLSRSRLLMQVQADLLQAPVEVYPSPNATALGVAALASLGMGLAGSAAEATGGWTPAVVYEPRISADQAETHLERWRRVAEATMGL